MQRTGSTAAGFDRRTVTIPVGLVAEVEGRVGNREFSAYVTEALRRKIEQDKLDELLADWAISEDVRTQTLTDLDAALSRSE